MHRLLTRVNQARYCASMTQTPSQVVARQVKRLRGERGLSAQRLAERCADLGMPELNRSVLANLENGRRPFVTLDELYVLALALNAPPVALLFHFPTAEVQVAPGTRPELEQLVRDWFDGRDGLQFSGNRGDDPAAFEQALPAGDRRRVRASRHPAVRAIERMAQAASRVVEPPYRDEDVTEDTRYVKTDADRHVQRDYVEERRAEERAQAARLLRDDLDRVTQYVNLLLSEIERED